MLARQIVNAIQAVVGPGPVALHEPRFVGNEWAYVKECLDSTYVSSVGKFVDRFEADLAAYTGTKHAVAVVNGTAALHVALRLAGVQSGDEVLIPALTFVATASAVVYCGAAPHFVDSEERTLGLDPGALREYLQGITEIRSKQCVSRVTGRVIRALVPMHTFGHPVDIEGLLAVARDFHLALVEDAAESLGSTVHGRHTGTFGLMGTLSFNGNKTITTGGGGAILTNDTDLAKRAKHLTTTAKVPHRWEYLHDEIGYNYRLPNVNAALGCAQLEQLPDFLLAKRRIFEHYLTAFSAVPQARIFAEPEGCRSNYWLQTLLLDESAAGQRDAILAATNDAGLMTRPTWTLMHRLAPYGKCPAMELPVAESLERRLINLPSSVEHGLAV
ncbi:MAG: aminotransferase DegT [Chloroflexi bacterium RBG_16_52_11]|nr:MAG: aminotransferase DegT [Chloroflexi bacterium RBG_16_52_11]